MGSEGATGFFAQLRPTQTAVKSSKKSSAKARSVYVHDEVQLLKIEVFCMEPGPAGSCREDGVQKGGRTPNGIPCPVFPHCAVSGLATELGGIYFSLKTHAPGGRSWASPALSAFLTATPCRAAVLGARSGEEGAVTDTGSWAGGPQHASKPCWTQAAFLVASLVSQGGILKPKAINALQGSRETELRPWCGT